MINMTHQYYHHDVEFGVTKTTCLLLLLGMDLLRLIQVEVDDDDDEEEELRCKRHRKEPSCVVGEHKHFPFGNGVVVLLPLSLVGDVEIVRLLWVLG